MMAAAQKIASAAVVTLINVQRMCMIESVSRTRNMAPLPYRNDVPMSIGPRLFRSLLSAMGMPRTVRLRIATRVGIIAPAPSAQTLLSVLLSSTQPQQRALIALPDHIRWPTQPDAKSGDVLRAVKVLRKPSILRSHQRQHF